MDDKYKELMDIDLGNYDIGRYTEYCGIHFDDVGDGYARSSSVVGKEHINLYGNAHGGYIASVMDTTAGLSVRYVGGTLRQAVTASCDVNYLRPIPEGAKISCEANVICAGKILARVETKVYHEELLVASGTFTFAYI